MTTKEMLTLPKMKMKPSFLLGGVARFLTSCSAAVTLTACGSGNRVEAPRPTSGVSAEFWLLSDTQLHNVPGDTTRARKTLADKVSTVAIRPPTVDLWSEVLLSSILQDMTSDGKPVFFLGDAANISCIDEYERFLREMSRVTWFGVLGNHDGYYMGNFTYLPQTRGSDPSAYTWFGACSRGGPRSAIADRMDKLEVALLNHGTADLGTHTSQGTLSKTNAVWLYLADLHRRGIFGNDPLDALSWKEEGDQRVFRASGQYVVGGQPQPSEFVAAIPSLKKDEKSAAWQAYVLQSVRLPDGTRMLMIDTSDYLNMPPSGVVAWQGFLAQVVGCAASPVNNSAPGVCGEVNEHQMVEVEKMLRSWGSQERFFLLGHHPWQALRKDMAKRLGTIRQDRRFITYLSAHTHDPAATVAFDGAEQWEVNIGSTTDEPMEYARVRFYPASGSTASDDVLEIDRKIVRTSEEGGGLAVCSDKEKKNELHYGKQDNYANRALSVYAELLKNIPGPDRQDLNDRAARASFPGSPDAIGVAESRANAARQASDVDKKLDELQRLAALDRQILRWSPWVRLMEQKCAVWASHAEGEKNGQGALKRSSRLKEGVTTFRVKPPRN